MQQATNAASKDRRQRKVEAEKLKTVRGLFPDESLDVILGELLANDWVVANAIDALEALRDLRAPATSLPPRPQQQRQASEHGRPPSRAQRTSAARPKDDWVVLAKADHRDSESQDNNNNNNDEDDHAGAVDQGVRQVEEALRKSILWDGSQAFSTSTLATSSSEATRDGTNEMSDPDRDQADRGILSAGDAAPRGTTSTEAATHGSGEGVVSEERRRRAEEHRRMMEEAERRWEEEKQRQAEAERLHARLQEHRERYHSGSLPTTAATISTAEVEERDEREAATASRQQQQQQQEEKEEEEEERRQVAHASMVALSRTLAGRLNPEQLGAVRAIPFAVTTDKAAKIFHDWRLSLWFTPTDFSQLLEAPSVSMTYVPYYCINVKSTCRYVSKVEVTRVGERKEHQMVEGQRESIHERSVCGAAHLRPEVAVLLSAIEPWDMEASVPLALPPVQPAQPSGGDDAVSVASLLEPRDVWCSIREWITAREKAECAKDVLLRSVGDDGIGDQPGSQEREASQQRVVDTTVTRMEYPETRYRVVYVPLYLVRYTQGDPQGERREYFFAINALTGKSHGQRPFGVGKVLGRGLSFLEGLLGLKDHHTVQIVRGSQLSQIDRRICYGDKEHYLIWPASHSYVITHATGFITLRNRSATHPVALLSQMRESKDITARYVLRPGETQSFNYRGFWCIRLELTDDAEGPPAALPSALSRAATFLFRGSAQPSPAPAALEQEVRWEEMIEVVGYSIDEGNHGNLLGMA